MGRHPTAILVLLTTLVTGCATTPPPMPAREATQALTETAGTRLGAAVAPETAARPGLTGVVPLAASRDAFAARMVLAAAADVSLDVQYYIWHGDITGTLLFGALHDAAERGVRVRLLLDDNNTQGLDPTLAALDAHPKIEVRLYNPHVQRQSRWLNYIGDFARVNRRMHNKSFTADNLATIVGGRNIGDEYFGAGDAVAFADLDVIAIGRAVGEVSQEFDLYWNSASAYPLRALVSDTAAPGALQQRVDAQRADPAARVYLDAVHQTPLLRELLERRLAWQWARAQVLYDDPAKTLDTKPPADVLLLPELLRAMGQAHRSLDLISPYFVPGEEGTEALAALARRGVRVRVLTNSLAASDVPPVHAGYAKRRVALLRAGVELFEFKPSAQVEVRETGAGASTGSSGASLHAKTFALDADRIFVGSFNFDPRSAALNTEMGLVIHNPILAAELSAAFERDIPRAAYQVVLAPDGAGLQWIERGAGGETRHATEPQTGWFGRAAVTMMSWLPIEWLL